MVQFIAMFGVSWPVIIIPKFTEREREHSEQEKEKRVSLRTNMPLKNRCANTAMSD